MSTVAGGGGRGPVSAPASPGHPELTARRGQRRRTSTQGVCDRARRAVLPSRDAIRPHCGRGRRALECCADSRDRRDGHTPSGHRRENADCAAGRATGREGATGDGGSGWSAAGRAAVRPAGEALNSWRRREAAARCKSHPQRGGRAGGSPALTSEVQSGFVPCVTRAAACRRASRRRACGLRTFPRCRGRRFLLCQAVRTTGWGGGRAGGLRHPL